MQKLLFICIAFLLGVEAFALSVGMIVQNETCVYANGSVFAAASGGVPPYTYIWGGGETTEGIANLSAGTYSVTVTDFVGTQVMDQATVITENYPDHLSFTHSYCPGENYHADFMPFPPYGLMGDFGPYTVSQGVLGEVPVIPPGNYYVDLGPLAPGVAFNLTVWDVNGCPTQLSGTAGAPAVNWPTVGVLDVEGSCANMNTGSITFSYIGGDVDDSWPILRQPGDGMFEINNSITSVGLGMYQFYNLAPGDYWLMVSLALTPSLVQGGSMCAGDSVLVTVPDLGGTCGVISGTTYMDYNSDCIDLEADASNVIVEIQPGPIYVNSGGSYSVAVPNGSYTLTTNAPAIAQSCPAAATVNGNDVTANIGHQPTLPLDVAITLSSGPARPGFQMQYLMHVENLSSSTSGATTTTLTFDPAVSFISAYPTPTNVSGTTITWDQGALSLFQQRDYTIELQVPPDVGLLGTDLLASAAVSCANVDGDLTNNNAAFSTTVTGSFDPNDKTAYTSTRESKSLYIINEDEYIDYVIRFQNTGTDLAFNIVVTDTLPGTLDLATVSLVGASHEHTWMLQGQGILKFIFPNILLPDSNANEPASHGLITFRIRPRQPLVAGTVIENTANIYFDFNEPVITEPSLLVAEFSTGVVHDPTGSPRQLTLLPNPASDQLTIASDATVDAITILAADGREVLRRLVRASSTSLDVSGLSPGSYFLNATMNSGSIIREHFIKN